MKNLLRKHRLAAFVGLTFLSSWICWLAVFDDLKPSLFEFDGGTLLIFLLGAYAPSLVALLHSFYLVVRTQQGCFGWLYSIIDPPWGWPES